MEGSSTHLVDFRLVPDVVRVGKFLLQRFQHSSLVAGPSCLADPPQRSRGRR